MVALGHSRKGAFTALVPCLPMFFSTWETYHTHTLYLGYFNGPTGKTSLSLLNVLTQSIEGLLLACTFMIMSGIYGPQIWTTPIASLVGHADIIGEYSLIDLWNPMIFTSFFVAHLPACVINVVKARRSKGLPIMPVFLDWTPMLIYASAIGAWLYSPYSNLLKDQRLVLFCLTMSFVFGRMTTKIILAHLTRQPFPYWTVMLAPLIGGAILVNLPLLGYSQISAANELIYLRCYFLFAMVAYLRWASLVINSICNYLGINCLRITENPPTYGKENGSAKQENGFARGKTD